VEEGYEYDESYEDRGLSILATERCQGQTALIILPPRPWRNSREMAGIFALT